MKPEEDDPKGILERLIEGMKEGGLEEETQTTFVKVRAHLLGEIETPKVM